MQPGWKPGVRASLVVGWLRISEMTGRTQGLPWALVLGKVGCDRWGHLVQRCFQGKLISKLCVCWVSVMGTAA